MADLTNAVFPSASDYPAPASGLIELHVDLFDSGGNPVDIGLLGINYVVPFSTDFSGTITTESAAADGLVSGNTLVLPLYVDNNVTSAAIDERSTQALPCAVTNCARARTLAKWARTSSDSADSVTP